MAKRSPMVLVVLLGETRAWELTAESFFESVLEPLGADLAYCGRADESPNPFFESAKYLWTWNESGDWEREYDDALGSDAWRSLLDVDPLFIGPLGGGKASAGILFFYRWLLRRSLEEERLYDEYDWFIVSRSDLMWPLPHPPVRYLSARHLYFPDGEQYGGVCDRHAVIPRRYARQYMSLADPIFTDPRGLRRHIDHAKTEHGLTVFNLETFLGWRLLEMGLWPRVRYFPYVPFAVRPEGGQTRWSVGSFDEELGYYVKYPTEKKRSEIAAQFVRDERSWRRYLSPVRGRRQRQRLQAAYKEHGLYERAFTPPPSTPRRELAAGTADRVLARVGRQLRKVPGMSALLDARLRKLKAKADRRQ